VKHLATLRLLTTPKNDKLEHAPNSKVFHSPPRHCSRRRHTSRLAPRHCTQRTEIVAPKSCGRKELRRQRIPNSLDPPERSYCPSQFKTYLPFLRNTNILKSFTIYKPTRPSIRAVIADSRRQRVPDRRQSFAKTSQPPLPPNTRRLAINLLLLSPDVHSLDRNINSFSQTALGTISRGETWGEASAK
jgi:hypothetical protein